MTVVCFLKCARDGATWNVAKYDPRLKHNAGVLHRIPEDTRSIFNQTGLLELDSCTELDPV